MINRALMPNRGRLGRQACDDGAVTPDRFADRLDAATYEHDEVVGLFGADPTEDDSLWLSERLFRRLTAVASAYELHTLPMLGGLAPVRLNQQGCHSLLDELEEGAWA
jgi:hypothetical protein